MDVRIRAVIPADAHIHAAHTGSCGPILLNGRPWRGSVNLPGACHRDTVIPERLEMKPHSLVTGDVPRFHPAGKKIFRAGCPPPPGTSHFRTGVVLSVEGEAQRLFP